MPAGTEDSPRLGDCAAGIRDGAEAERANNRVEALVGEVQRLRVAESEIRVTSEVTRAVSADREHLLAEFDSRERHLSRVVGKIACGADRELEHPSLRLAADPFAAALEEQAFEEGDLLVVVRCPAVLQSTHSRGLRRDVESLVHP